MFSHRHLNQFSPKNYAKMALAELCGMSDFDTFNREDNIHNEIVKMSNNFTLNTHLSVPPFANVSYPKSHYQI